LLVYAFASLQPSLLVQSHLLAMSPKNLWTCLLMKGFCRIISRSGRERGVTESMAEIRDRRLAEKLGCMGGYFPLIIFDERGEERSDEWKGASEASAGRVVSYSDM